MTDSPASRLAAIAERESRATKGPWNSADEHPRQACVYVRPDADNLDEMATCYAFFVSKDQSAIERARNNANFIAHARSDIPWLLSRLAESERRNGELVEALKPFAGIIDWLAEVQSVDRDAVIFWPVTIHASSGATCAGYILREEYFHRARALTAKGE